MKKNSKIIKIIIILLISFFLFLLINQETILEKISKDLNTIDFNSKKNIFILIILSFVYLLTPFPADIIVLFNGFVLGAKGFYL